MKYISQIDMVKGLAILGVMVSHTLNRSILINAMNNILGNVLILFLPLDFSVKSISATMFEQLLALTINQSVNIFFVIMGVNTGISFSRGGFKNARQYVSRRLERLLFPFMIIYIISLFYGIYIGKYYLGWMTVLFKLPIPSLGDWFVAIMIEWIFIAPILYIFYKKSPWLMISISFFISLTIEIISYLLIKEDPFWSNIVLRLVLTWIFGIAVGLFLSDDVLAGHVNIKDKKYKFVQFGLPISLLILLMDPLNIVPFWGKKSVFAQFYPVFLTIFLLNMNWENRLLMRIGRGSYHILLVQSIYFANGFSLSHFITSENVIFLAPIYIPLDIAIPTILGLAFEKLNEGLLRLIHDSRKSKRMSNKEDNKELKETAY